MYLIWWISVSNNKVAAYVRKEDGEKTLLIMTAEKFHEDFGMTP